MGSLYLGAIITALAAPELLAAANVVEGPGGRHVLPRAGLPVHRGGAGTLSGAGWGWQAVLGAILAAIGGSSMAVPGFNDN